MNAERWLKAQRELNPVTQEPRELDWTDDITHYVRAETQVWSSKSRQWIATHWGQFLNDLAEQSDGDVDMLLECLGEPARFRQEWNDWANTKDKHEDFATGCCFPLEEGWHQCPTCDDWHPEALHLTCACVNDICDCEEVPQ